MTRLIVPALVLILTSAAMADESHASVELTTSMSTVRPGSSLMVGVRFKIDDGWHIYWKNPGDSGAPTKIKATTPTGLSAGATLYPVPKRMALPGDIVNYGYESEAVFLVPVTLAADTPQGPATVKVDVDYLVCSEACIPGHFSGDVTVTVGGADTPDHAADFEAAAKNLPASKSAPGLIRHDTTAESAGNDVRMVIVLTWEKAPEKVDWLPDLVPDCDVNDIKSTTADGKTRISFTVVPAAAKKVPPTVAGVVAYESTGRVLEVSTTGPGGNK